jgi:monoterpene epsilon-lactone hydrolase
MEVGMSQEQREAIGNQLRSAPRSADRTTAGQRASFEDRFRDRSLGEGVTLRARSLGGRQALDIAVDGAGRDGVILYLHGGGYVLGSAQTGTHLATALARRVGSPAVSLEYRLAPEHPFPAAVEDVLAAYRELLDGGLRASDIVLAGDSAGGGLAIATMLAAGRADLPQPAGAAIFSPWVDLTLAGESMDTRAALDPIFNRERLGALADQYLAGQDPRDELISPVFADLTGLPPLLVQVGSHEVLLDDAVRLASRARECEVDVILDVVAGVPHVFQSFAGTLDEADEALDRAGRFLARRLSAQLVW